MRRPTGYGVTTSPDHPPIKRDTISCGHCQRIVFVKPGEASTVYLIFDRVRWAWKEEMGAFCRLCMRPVCLQCHGYGGCIPWEKKIEISEARDRFCRALGIGS